MTTASRCGSIDISPRDALTSAGWMLGLSLALAVAGVALDKSFGPSVLIEALLHSSFFIALTLSLGRIYLKAYSPAARNVITAIAIPGWYAFFLMVAVVAART